MIFCKPLRLCWSGLAFPNTFAADMYCILIVYRAYIAFNVSLKSVGGWGMELLT